MSVREFYDKNAWNNWNNMQQQTSNHMAKRPEEKTLSETYAEWTIDHSETPGLKEFWQ